MRVLNLLGSNCTHVELSPHLYVTVQTPVCTADCCASQCTETDSRHRPRRHRRPGEHSA